MRIAAPLALVLALSLAACGGGGGSDTGGSNDSTSGADFTATSKVDSPSFDEAAAVEQNDGAIDTSSVSKGLVFAEATSGSRLKFLVESGDMSYNYDLPTTERPSPAPSTWATAATPSRS